MQTDRGLSALWEYVEENWEEAAAHDALLQACDAAGALAFGASLYRKELESENSSRVERSEEQLRKITVLAFAQIEASQSMPPNTKRWTMLLAAAVSSLLIGACLYAISR